MRSKLSRVAAKRDDVTVVCSGLADVEAASVLRHAVLVPALAIVDEEPDLPHEGPPLSNHCLHKDMASERLLISQAICCAERDVTRKFATLGTLVDAMGHHVIADLRVPVGYGAATRAIRGKGRTDAPKIVDWCMTDKTEVDPMITLFLGWLEIDLGESTRSVMAC